VKNSCLRPIAIAVMIVCFAVGANGCAPVADDTIEFGWTAWSDAEFVARLAKRLIEDNTDYRVELKLAAIGDQYAGVASGTLDGMLMAWLPDAHASYLEAVDGDIVDLGTLYDGARVGWAVPGYIPEDMLSSIADLAKPEVVAMLDGEIQGVDPGAGLMQLSEQALHAYGLSSKYRLLDASGAAMTAALAKAENRNAPIVITGWTPHWAFSRWGLRFLDDPKNMLGTAQRVDVLVRKGFSEDYPEVGVFLSRFSIPLDSLQKSLNDARQSSEDEAIDRWVEAHPTLIAQWFSQK